MSKQFILICLTFILSLFFSITAGAQDTIDCVYLNNGSIIKGVIVEQIPGESIKIKTADGSLFVFKISEISDIKKEIRQSPSSSLNTQKQESVGKLSWEYKNKRVVVDGETKQDLSGVVLKRLLGDADYNKFSEAQAKYAAGKSCMKSVYWSAGIMAASCAVMVWEITKLDSGELDIDLWTGLIPGVIGACAELYGIINLAIGVPWIVKSRKTLDRMVSDYNGSLPSVSYQPTLKITPTVMEVASVGSGNYSAVPGIKIGLSF